MLCFSDLQNPYICDMTTFPLFISGAEIFFIIFIVLMVFGADKVPEIARGLGKGMRQIKDATNISFPYFTATEHETIRQNINR